MGIGVLYSRTVIRSALFLILTLIGVANVFLFANSEFLWVIQLSVYSGGIAVLLLFAGRLTSYTEDNFEFFNSNLVMPVIVAGVLLLVLLGTLVAQIPASTGNIFTTNNGNTLLEQFFHNIWQENFGLAFILPFLSALFLAALLGSVKLAMSDDSDDYEEKPKLYPEETTT